MTTRPLRTALLGCGSFAAKHAARLVTLPDNFQLIAFCDRHHERAARLAGQFTQGKAQLFTDHNTLLEQTDLDALLICLPPYGHLDEVEQAAARGVHIFMEKPIALTSQQAWRMVDAAEATGIVTQVGFMFRFGAAVQKLRQMIEDGVAGQAGLMSARYFCNSLHADWWRRKEKSGGQLVEQVIHMFDLMRFLMGEARSVYSLQRNLFHQDVPGYSVEDVSSTVIDFASGAIGVLYATNNAIPGRWVNDYRVVAGNVTVEFANANEAEFTFTSEASLHSERVASDADPYIRELLDFHDAIRTGRPAQIPLREGALSLELALAASRSAESGAPVIV